MAPFHLLSRPRLQQLLTCTVTSQFRSCRPVSTLPNSPLFQKLLQHSPSRRAVVHSLSDKAFTYASLLQDVAVAKHRLSGVCGGHNAQGKRIAFMAENGYDYVVMLLSILALNAVALPIANTHPISEIRYVLEHSDTSLLLSTTSHQEKAEDVLNSDSFRKTQLDVVDEIEMGSITTSEIQLEDTPYTDGGLMLFTSGTTSRPKGVLLSSSVMMAQAQSLIEAWQYDASDLLLHVLPLHHIHGIINALFTPLVAGSTIEFLFPFNVDKVWKRFAAPFSTDLRQQVCQPVTFFTAVPMIYSKLLASFASLDGCMQSNIRRALSPENLRLNISGSAALPTPIKAAWTNISGGNVLLERYGMTEVGMALSGGLDFKDRVDGSVGWPLPSVEVRLVDVETGHIIEDGQEVDEEGESRAGEIQLRGPTCFSSYWRNAQAEMKDFVAASDDGGRWFRTGDIATRQLVLDSGTDNTTWASGPMYFIKGRQSVDIIKAGGEKISALEVERELLSLPEIAEAAVIGVESDAWGQKVAAVVVLAAAGLRSGRYGKAWTAIDIRRALKDRLASHKIPQVIRIVEQIPRNAMGKVNKTTLLQDIS